MPELNLSDKYSFQNYIATIIFAVSTGIIFSHFSIIYTVLFLIAAIALVSWHKFELAYLANCLGFILIPCTALSTKALTVYTILFLILVISYFLSGNRLDRIIFTANGITQFEEGEKYDSLFMRSF